MVVKSHFERNSRAAVWASTSGWPVMLAETSISRKTRISSGGRAAAGRLGRAAQPREIVGDRLDGHRQPVRRVALDGLHLHDAVGVVRQADVDRHLGVGRRGCSSKTYLPRIVQSSGAALSPCVR